MDVWIYGIAEPDENAIWSNDSVVNFCKFNNCKFSLWWECLSFIYKTNQNADQTKWWSDKMAARQNGVKTIGEIVSITCLKLTIESVEKDVNYFQS